MKKISKQQIFLFGWLIYILISLTQAAFTEIHYDEAYYWLYSRFMSWGYFDHPPMVAALIFLGTKFLGGFLGLRFFFVLLSSISFFLMWQMVKKYYPNPLIFWLMVFSISMWIPYTMFAIPDVPLFFFTVLFLWLYQQYLNNKSWLLVLAMAISISGMIYSKYHGFLVLLFIFLSNWKLIKEKTAWALVVLTILLMLPHFYWQFDNQFPTLKYHLVDSHQSKYKVDVTLNYLLACLLLTGPLLGWLYLFSASKYKPKNTWEKGLKFIFAGVFIFFFVASFFGDAEAHWPLVAYIPMFILAYIYFGENPKWHHLVKKLGIIGFALFLAVRIFIIVWGENGPVKALRGMNGWKEEIALLQNEAGNRPVVFQDAYQKAARYAYFTNLPENCFSLNSCFNRFTQYDLYPIEEKLQGEDVLFITQNSLQANEEFYKIEGKKKVWYLHGVKNFQSYNLLEIYADTSAISQLGNAILLDEIQLFNPYARTIWLEENPNLQAHLQLFVRDEKKWIFLSDVEMDNLKIESNESITLKDVEFILPDTLEGKHQFLIGLQNGPFSPVHSHLSFKRSIN